MIAWFLSLSFIITVHAAPVTNHGAVRWAQLAERMTGESDHVRDECLRQIKATPQIADLLRAELRKPSQPSHTRMYLALDVISALKLRELLPDLIELSETESSGYLYNTINTLVTAQNRASIIALYRDRVSIRQTPPAARMVLIDTLARFGAAMKPSDLEQLLGDEAMGVRQTALSYARTFLTRGLQTDYLPLVKEQLKKGSVALRIQSIFLLRELQKNKNQPGFWLEDCRGDENETVRTLCLDKVKS